MDAECTQDATPYAAGWRRSDPVGGEVLCSCGSAAKMAGGGLWPRGPAGPTLQPDAPNSARAQAQAGIANAAAAFTTGAKKKAGFH